jgi:hypothetical protein
MLNRARAKVGVTSSALIKVDGEYSVGERGMELSIKCRGIIGASKGDERGGNAGGGKASFILAEEMVLLGGTLLGFLDESGDDEVGRWGISIRSSGCTEELTRPRPEARVTSELLAWSSWSWPRRVRCCSRINPKKRLRRTHLPMFTVNIDGKSAGVKDI